MSGGFREGGSKGGPEVLGGKTAKNTKKPEKRAGTVASLVRSNIQDFVQEVPVGQMAQGTPLKGRRICDVL